MINFRKLVLAVAILLVLIQSSVRADNAVMTLNWKNIISRLVLSILLICCFSGGYVHADESRDNDPYCEGLRDTAKSYYQGLKIIRKKVASQTLGREWKDDRTFPTRIVKVNETSLGIYPSYNHGDFWDLQEGCGIELNTLAFSKWREAHNLVTVWGRVRLYEISKQKETSEGIVSDALIIQIATEMSEYFYLLKTHASQIMGATAALQEKYPDGGSEGLTVKISRGGFYQSVPMSDLTMHEFVSQSIKYNENIILWIGSGRISSIHEQLHPFLSSDDKSGIVYDASFPPWDQRKDEHVSNVNLPQDLCDFDDDKCFYELGPQKEIGVHIVLVADNGSESKLGDTAEYGHRLRFDLQLPEVVGLPSPRLRAYDEDQTSIEIPIVPSLHDPTLMISEIYTLLPKSIDPATFEELGVLPNAPLFLPGGAEMKVVFGAWEQVLKVDPRTYPSIQYAATIDPQDGSAVDITGDVYFAYPFDDKKRGSKWTSKNAKLVSARERLIAIQGFGLPGSHGEIWQLETNNPNIDYEAYHFNREAKSPFLMGLFSEAKTALESKRAALYEYMNNRRLASEVSHPMTEQEAILLAHDMNRLAPFVTELEKGRVHELPQRLKGTKKSAISDLPRTPEILLIKARLKEGAEPGDQWLSLNGVQVQWNLQYADNLLDVGVIRDDLTSHGEPTSTLFPGERFLIEARAQIAWSSETLTGSLYHYRPDHSGAIGLVEKREIELSRLLGDPTLYRSIWMQAKWSGAPLFGSPTGSGEKVIQMEPGDWLVVTINGPVPYLQRRQSMVALRSHPGAFKWSWNNSVQRALECYPDATREDYRAMVSQVVDSEYHLDVSPIFMAALKAGDPRTYLRYMDEGNWDDAPTDLKQSVMDTLVGTTPLDANGADLPEDERRPESYGIIPPTSNITLGHHASAILLREKFINMMQQSLIDLRNQRFNDPGLNAFYERLLSGPIPMFSAIEGMEITGPNENSVSFARLRLLPKTISVELGVPLDEVEEWRRNEFRNAFSKTLVMMDDGISYAEGLEDCDWPELFEFTSLNFEMVVSALWSEMMELYEVSPEAEHRRKSESILGEEALSGQDIEQRILSLNREAAGSSERYFEWRADREARLMLERYEPFAAKVTALNKASRDSARAVILVLGEVGATRLWRIAKWAGARWYKRLRYFAERYAPTLFGSVDFVLTYFFFDVPDYERGQKVLAAIKGGSVMLGPEAIRTAENYVPTETSKDFAVYMSVVGIIMPGIVQGGADIASSYRSAALAKQISRGRLLVGKMDEFGYMGLRYSERMDMFQFLVDARYQLAIEGNLNGLDTLQQVALRKYQRHLAARGIDVEDLGVGKKGAPMVPTPKPSGISKIGYAPGKPLGHIVSQSGSPLTRLGDDIDEFRAGATAEEMFNPMPGGHQDSLGREIVLGERVGLGQYFDVHDLKNAADLGLSTKAGRRYVVKFGRWNEKNGLRGPKDIQDKIGMMRDVQRHLSDAGIPYARVVAKGEINGRPFVIHENVDEALSQTFSEGNIDQLWRAELHGKALVILQRKLADIGLVWMDPQPVNAFYRFGPTGIEAGILNVDLIAPVTGGDKIFREMMEGFSEAPNIFGAQSLSGRGHKIVDPYVLAVKMLEVSGLIGYNTAVGTFVSKRARLADVEAAFPGFREIIGGPGLSRNAQFGMTINGRRLQIVENNVPPLIVEEIDNLDELVSSVESLPSRRYFQRRDIRDVVIDKYKNAEDPIPPIHTTDYETFRRIIRSSEFNPSSTKGGGPYFSAPNIGVVRDGEIAIRIRRGSEKYIEWGEDLGNGNSPIFYRDGKANGARGTTYVPAEHLDYLDPGDGVQPARWKPVPSAGVLDTSRSLAKFGAPRVPESSTTSVKSLKPKDSVVVKREPGTASHGYIITDKHAYIGDIEKSVPMASVRQQFGSDQVNSAIQRSVERQGRSPKGPLLNTDEVIDQALNFLKHMERREKIGFERAKQKADEITQTLSRSNLSEYLTIIGPKKFRDELSESLESAVRTEGPNALNDTTLFEDAGLRLVSEVQDIDPNATVPPPGWELQVRPPEKLPDGVTQERFDQFVDQAVQLGVDRHTAETLAVINYGHQVGDNGAVAGLAFQRNVPVEDILLEMDVSPDDLALGLDRYLESVLHVTDPLDRLIMVDRYMGDAAPDGVSQAIWKAMEEGKVTDPSLPKLAGKTKVDGDPLSMPTPSIDTKAPGFLARDRMLNEHRAARQAIQLGETPQADLDILETVLAEFSELEVRYQDEAARLAERLVELGVDYYEALKFSIQRFAQDGERLLSPAGRAELLLEAISRFGHRDVSLSGIAAWTGADDGIVADLADDVHVAFDAGINGDRLVPARFTEVPSASEETLFDGVSSNLARFELNLRNQLETSILDARNDVPGAKMKMKRLLQLIDDLDQLTPYHRCIAIGLALDLRPLGLEDIDAIEFSVFEVGRRSLDSKGLVRDVALAEGVLARGNAVIDIKFFEERAGIETSQAAVAVQTAYRNMGRPPNTQQLVPHAIELRQLSNHSTDPISWSSDSILQDVDIQFEPVREAEGLFERAEVLRRLAGGARKEQLLDLAEHYDKVATSLQRQATSLMFGNLRFGPNDVVYGPVAMGALARLGEHGGAPTLFDFMHSRPHGQPITEFSFDFLDEIHDIEAKVHFDLTHLREIDQVLIGEGQFGQKITAAELHYIHENWGDFEDVVIFYRDGQVTSAPWEGSTQPPKPTLH